MSADKYPSIFSRQMATIVYISYIILHLKGNIIWTQSQITWTCSVGSVMSLSVAFISFGKIVAIDFC